MLTQFPPTQKKRRSRSSDAHDENYNNSFLLCFSSSYRTSYKWQKLGAGKGPRHGHKHRGIHRAEPRIEQASNPGIGGKYEAFPGDGKLRIDENLQRLGPDFTREEILLKV